MHFGEVGCSASEELLKTTCFPVLYYGLCPVNRDQVKLLDYGVHSCFRNFFSTRYQSVVEQCVIFFERYHGQDTMRERKRKFLHKFRMSPNLVCDI